MQLNPIVAEKNPWWRDPAARAARHFPHRRVLQRRVRAQVENLEDARGVLLVGPRKVGKTVLLRQTIDDLLDQGWPPHNLTYFDFSDDRIVADLSPRAVVESLPPAYDPEHPRALFFDEIRDSTGWDAWLKQAVDDRLARIVATDSAASLLRGESRTSGTRVDELHLEGLSFEEFLSLHGAADETAEQTFRRLPNALERYLLLGGFPEHSLSENVRLVRERLRRDVVESAILRDLLPFGIDVDAARRLFIYLVQASGSIFVARRRGEEIQADERSVKQYLGLLEDTMLLASLHSFTARPAVALRRSAHPKIYAADHGLIGSFSLAPEEARSQLFEAVVFRHLREIARTRGGEVGFLRGKDGKNEVDFVVASGGRRIVIEVTHSARIRAEKLDTVRTAGQILRTQDLFLIHGGLDTGVNDGVRLMPLPAFLLDPDRVLEAGP
jgi:hypothetical protein